MRRRAVWWLVAVLALGAAGCGGGADDEPAAVRFTAVELPAAAVPVALSAAGDALLIGVRRDGQPVVPGLLRRGADGAVTELAVHGATPYGRLATWRSIASDGERIVAIGGEHGGAHGHVRWSVWTGTATGPTGGAGVTELPQAFSTFGGYEAGDLVDAVLTPHGGALVGAWASARVGFDVAVWTPSGGTGGNGGTSTDWVRQPSAGTALESGPEALAFPMGATSLRDGVLVAGWQLGLDANGRQQPAVWHSSSGVTGWTSTTLPDSGRAGSAVAVRCWEQTCGVAGRVDGALALWRLADDRWVRLAGTAQIPVGDRDRLAPPILVGEALAHVVSDGGQVKIARVDGDRWTVQATEGPTGTVTAATTIGDTVYLVAGPDERNQTLWQADLGAG